MENAVILGSIFLLLAVSFFIGVRSKKTDSAASFIGSAKSFGPIVVALSGTAAMASGWMLVGTPGDMYTRGNAMTNWSLLSACFALSYVFLGKKIRALAELKDVSTLGDILDIRYNNNKILKGIVSFIIFIGCFAYLASQIAAGAGLFTFLFGWDKTIAAFVLFGVVIVYVAVGGESAGIMSQAFQGLVMVVAGIIIIGLFYFKLGGFSTLMNNVASNPTVTANGVTSTFSSQFFSAFGVESGARSMTWIVLAFLGTVCQPATLTRMFALKDPTDLPRLGILTGATQAVVCFFGLTIGFSVISLVASGNIAPLNVADHATWHLGAYLGLGVQVLIYTAVMAAIISSASTYLSVGAASISKDFLSSFGFKFKDKTQIAITRSAIVLVGLLAILLASFSGETVAMLAALGWATFVSVTLPVFVIGLVWKKANEKGMTTAAVVALIGNFIGMISLRMNVKWPKGLPWYMYLITVTVFIGVFVSLATYKKETDGVNKYVEAALRL